MVGRFHINFGNYINFNLIPFFQLGEFTSFIVKQVGCHIKRKVALNSFYRFSAGTSLDSPQIIKRECFD